MRRSQGSAHYFIVRSCEVLHWCSQRRPSLFFRDEFQGRSDVDKSSALDGLKQRRMERDFQQKKEQFEKGKRGLPKGREYDFRLLPMPMPTTGPKKGKRDQFTGHMGIGIPGSQEYSRPKKRGKPRRGGTLSIASALASMRGGI